MITPRKPDSREADAPALLDYIDALAKAQVDGLVLFGTSGEFIHYDVSERHRILAVATRRSPLPLVVNVSHSSLRGAVELAEHAAANGATGLLLMPPYFYHYSEDQIFEFYQQFVKAMGGRHSCLSVQHALFHQPPDCAAVRASFFDGALLPGLKIPAASGVCSRPSGASANRQYFRTSRAMTACTYASAPTARTGIISGVAGAVPELVVALDRAVLSNDKARVRLLNAHLQQLLKYLSRFPAPIGTRHAAVARGWKMAADALPFDEATSAGLAEFRIGSRAGYLLFWRTRAKSDVPAGRPNSFSKVRTSQRFS